MAISDVLDADRLLDALDGVAYVVDSGGIILAVGRGGWCNFANENGVPELTPEVIVGSSLFSHIQGAKVRDVCRRIHDSVCRVERPVVSFEYRCDAPGLERRMRMSISAVRDRTGSVAALYQSQVLSEMPRMPLGLLARPSRRAATIERATPVTLCSFCHNVAWPIGAPEQERTWIGIADYYRRGGVGDVAVSHGICPECIEAVGAIY
jgi:hypothetical protein